MPPSPILSLLSAHLPYSLPLYRRLQFLDSNPNTSTRIITIPFLAAIPLFHDSSPESIAKTPPWTAACVDLTRAPETQIWMFSSIELPSIENLNPYPTKDGQTFRECVRQQLDEIISIVYKDIVPEFPESAPSGYNVMRMGEALPYSRSRVIIGTLHKTLRALVPASTIARVDAPHLKYIFPSSSFSEPVNLPPEFAFCELELSHLETAINRTHIPRSIPTLRKMYGRGIIHAANSDPIAWGFLGIDGSLSTLHTEPHYRGNGLGVQISRHLFQSQGALFDARTDWAHADVSEENYESRRVMEKIGGNVVWESFWIEVELERWLSDNR